MEPKLVTKPELLNILEELKKLEPVFHRPELGTSRKDFEEMIENSFWEVGASGRRYSREYVLDVLEERSKSVSEDNWPTKDFQCLEIAKDNYLLTYTLSQGDRITRRASIWRRIGKGWKILYHQGTIVNKGN
ncbi:MAG: hypothetical protein P8Z35_18500 [Ignavibacteriaceae bacterium]